MTRGGSAASTVTTNRDISTRNHAQRGATMSEAPTVAGTVAQLERPARLIEQGTGEFAKVLPAGLDAERFARWGLSVLKNGLAHPSEAQRKAWSVVLAPDNEGGRLSVLAALMDCASLGLEPGRTYHLVPFAGTVTGMTDYKGEVQLITNARKSSVVAQLVRAGDLFAMRGANYPPNHQPPDPEDAASWFDDGRPVVGGYAYVAYADGDCSEVTRMSEAAFLKRYAIPRNKAVWDQWPDEMRRKTLVHAMRKTVPWSPVRLWES